MNIYDFINSKDMRNYLQEIQYQFTEPEAAFIVYWCKHATLDEKIEAWYEIIKTLPDCSMESRLNMMQIDSFHAFLKDYIALQKQDIKNFYIDDGYIYRYEYHELETQEWYSALDMFFSNYASCMDYCREKILADGDVDSIRILKCLLDQTEDRAQNSPNMILFNNKLEILEVSVSHEEEYDFELNASFDGMCFDFPTPFKRGDILVDYTVHKTDWGRPFVLSYLTTWSSKEMFRRGFHEHECPFQRGWEDYDKFVRETLKTRDASDMHAIGTVIWDEEGTLDIDHTHIIPIDLEYYREPLKGIERQLQVVSWYEKGEADASMLVNCCSAIRIEECSKKIGHQYTKLYRKESMEQVGILSADTTS